MKISKLHEYIKNCRRDFLHKLSKKLSEDYNAVVVENLNMKGMSQALNFGKSVGDNGWGMFLRMLEYKLMFLGKQFLKIDKWFPSSKTCSRCGNVKEELKLSERSYKCECCGIEIDRDYNAALNIRDVGKEMLKYQEIKKQGRDCPKSLVNIFGQQKQILPKKLPLLKAGVVHHNNQKEGQL